MIVDVLKYNQSKIKKGLIIVLEEWNQIREKLWKEVFWSQSFCLLTTGGVTVEVVRQYIESQGEKKRE